MKKTFALTLFTAALVLAAIFIIGCNSKPSAESIKKGQNLAYSRCTACHKAANFEKHKYSRGEWQSVINRMMSHGAQFTPDEQGLIADFLSSKFGK
jgi:cytochrome c2